jgi:hypothetical protein
MGCIFNGIIFPQRFQRFKGFEPLSSLIALRKIEPLIMLNPLRTLRKTWGLGIGYMRCIFSGIIFLSASAVQILMAAGVGDKSCGTAAVFG